MHCPKCGAELNMGNVYCPECGEEIQIVPDYDPLDDLVVGDQETSSVTHSVRSVLEKTKNLGKSGKKKKQDEKSDKDSDDTSHFMLKLILLCMGILIGLVIVVAVLIISARRDSFAYYLNKGQEQFENGETEESIITFRHALDKDGDAQDYMLAHLYIARASEKLGDKEGAISHLKESISYASSIENLVSLHNELFFLMSGTSYASEINEIIDSCPNVKAQEIIEHYRIEKPKCSMKSGVFNYYIYPQLTAEYGEIYYTLDGSTPNPDDPSQLYNGRLELQEGDNLLTAVAVNEQGIVSDQCLAVFTLDFSGAVVPEENGQ